MSLVLDASLTLAWFFEDERTPEADAVLDRVVAAGAVVPPLWALEVGNALHAALRRGRIDREYREAALETLRRLPVSVDADMVRHAWTGGLVLADAHDLTLYDAIYLELAERRDLPLATLDRPLRRAAEAVGRPLLGS